jgi:hypothetical protein
MVDATYECYGFQVQCRYDPGAHRMVGDFFGPPGGAVSRSGATVQLTIEISDRLAAEPVEPPHNPSVMMADPVVIDAASSRAVLDPAAWVGRITLGRRDLDNQVVWGRWLLERLFLYLVGRSPRHYPLHAGAIELAGHSVALVAEGGAGKSTFACWALHRGATLVGEDILVRHLDEPVAALWGYPRALYVARELAGRVPELVTARTTPIDGGSKARVTVPAGLAGRIGSTTRPTSLLFLVRGAPATARPVTLDDAVERCRADFSVGKRAVAVAEVEADLRTLLAGVRRAEFAVSDDLDESFDRLRDLLR